MLISIPHPHCIPKHKDPSQRFLPILSSSSSSFCIFVFLSLVSLLFVFLPFLSPHTHLLLSFRTLILLVHLQKMNHGWKMVSRLTDDRYWPFLSQTLPIIAHHCASQIYVEYTEIPERYPTNIIILRGKSKMN